jgi:hypothetical protein
LQDADQGGEIPLIESFPLAVTGQRLDESHVPVGRRLEELLAQGLDKGLFRGHGCEAAIQVSPLREPSPGKEGVAGQMAMVCLQGIGTPEDGQIRVVATIQDLDIERQCLARQWVVGVDFR